jgi:putative protein-disulfide isomerase
MAFRIQSIDAIHAQRRQVRSSRRRFDLSDEAIKLEYFYDPFCGWCYASAPAVAAIAEAYPDALLMRPSGLFANGDTIPVSAMADHAWRNDRRIAALTGQTVTVEYHDRILRNPDGLFDSTYATRAIVALGEIDAFFEPELLHALQIARYVDAKDTARAEIVAAVAAEVARLHGQAIDESAFADRLRNDEVLAAATAEKMQETASRMQMLPGSGIPRLLVSVGDHREVIQNEDLYSGAEAVVRAIASVAARAASKSSTPSRP